MDLRNELRRLSQNWIEQGQPPREKLNQTANELRRWKKQHAVEGIWSKPPLMVTATLDDGIGQGIEIINLYADVAGFELHFLGVLQSPDAILEACRQYRPAILGLTILQLDSDEDLARIGRHLPPDTALVAGGPVFQYDPELAQRGGVTYAAPNLAGFIDFLLDWEPGHDAACR